jgi:GNAT superfamily N-acetyltransferase
VPRHVLNNFSILLIDVGPICPSFCIVFVSEDGYILASMALTLKPVSKAISPALWFDLEKLFGRNGACGGCWCMFWRHPKGEKWDDMKGSVNKARFKKLVHSRKAHGALAYLDGEPVGWVSFDRRVEYDRLNRSPTLACDDAEQVWSIPCFYIKPGYRSRGVATALLEFALRDLEKRRAKIVEGYPVLLSKGQKIIPAAFAYTGTVSLFQKAGFKVVTAKDRGKQRMRKVMG